MAIPLPQVLVFQEFNLLPSEITEPLRPFVFGPEYKLHRYTEAKEKRKAGPYDPTIDAVFTWAALGKEVGSIVDPGYTSVQLENALLTYFDVTASGTPVAGAKNRVDLARNLRNSGTINAVTGAYQYPLDAVFQGREVKVGDYAEVSGVTPGGRVKLLAQISGFAANVAAASIDPGTSDVGNAATQTANTPTATRGTTNIGDHTLTIAGTYTGVVDGVIKETYKVTCIKGTDTHDLKTAIFKIESASKTDDNPAFQPALGADGTTIADFNVPLSLGTRGLTMSFVDPTTPTEISVGDFWQVGTAGSEARGAFTAGLVTSGGTYSGARDTTYILTAIRGGTISVSTATCPQVKVQTNNGYDTGAPVNVTSNATHATGTVTIAGTIQTGDVVHVVVNGINVATTVTASETTATLVAAKVVSTINAHATASLVVTASNLAGVITLTARTGGTAGNTVTLTANVTGTTPTTTATAGGATLTGGVNGGVLAIGTYGVTAMFAAGSQLKIRKGDKWTITAHAQGNSNIQKFTLDKSIPAELLALSTLDVKLFIQKNVELPPKTTGAVFTPNWDQDDTAITLQAGMPSMYDATWQWRHGRPAGCRAATCTSPGVSS
jgi:hypothetical protein